MGSSLLPKSWFCFIGGSPFRSSGSDGDAGIQDASSSSESPNSSVSCESRAILFGSGYRSYP